MVWTTLIAGLLGMSAPDPGLLAATSATQAGIEAGYASAVAQAERPSTRRAESLANGPAPAPMTAFTGTSRVADPICADDRRAGQGEVDRSDSAAGAGCAGHIQFPGRAGADLAAPGPASCSPAGALRLSRAAPKRAGPGPGQAIENPASGLGSASIMSKSISRVTEAAHRLNLRFRPTDGSLATALPAQRLATVVPATGKGAALAQAVRAASPVSMIPLSQSPPGQGRPAGLARSTESEVGGGVAGGIAPGTARPACASNPADRFAGEGRTLFALTPPSFSEPGPGPGAGCANPFARRTRAAV